MSKPHCLFESISNRFNFGRYNGLSLSDVLEINPSYVTWCVTKCDGVHFLITDDVIEQIKQVYPEYPIPDSFINECRHRFVYFENDSYEDEDCFEENNYYERECDSYGRYAGSYAQDEMGYTDDEIDIIFDGDPSAYWNID